MQKFDIVVESDVELTPRVSQVSAMFDVPIKDKIRHEWKVRLPIDEFDWKVGLIVGPSGSGKTIISRKLFGKEKKLRWNRNAVVDNVKGDLQEITTAFASVGFNTIPSWCKPFAVLSNGEQFRATVARRLVEERGLILVDEFTSVVDRQVAKIASHAIQKFVRKMDDRQFVAVSCHYDVIDWLQPDWTYDPSRDQFSRRLLRRRPTIAGHVGRVPYCAWRIFAPYHYLTASLNPAARCFGLWCDNHLAAFGGVLFRPRRVRTGLDVMGLSRMVTLPDFQGIGLAFILMDILGAAYVAIGKRFHTYPAHPPFVRAFDRSPHWSLFRPPGQFRTKSKMDTGRRPCAVFAYCGPRMSDDDAHKLLRH